jgi:hypothetical protein
MVKSLKMLVLKEKNYIRFCPFLLISVLGGIMSVTMGPNKRFGLTGGHFCPIVCVSL